MSQTETGGGDARRAAAELLLDVLEERRTLDEAMAGSAAMKRMQGSDRAFARAIASAVLRQLGRIDLGLAPFLNRPIHTAAPPARALLRIGAAQLWLLETPPHAAVGETVAAAKRWKRASRSAGFLNAVLRKAADDRTAFDAAPALAVWPDWLREAMTESLGGGRAETLALAQADLPPLFITPKQDPAAVAAEIEGAVMASGSVLAPAGRVEAMDGFADGNWWVQDEAAALPAKLLNAQSDDVVFDLCAAPGGKTLQLAASGAAVTAVDRSSKRLERLHQNLDRTGLGGRVTVIPLKLETWNPDSLADKILLDAPCSALGTLRRHPEGAWIKRPADVARYPDIQSKMLTAAHAMLAPDGTLVYCVCTPLRGEGVDVVEAAIAEGLFIRDPVTPGEAPGFEGSITEAGDVLTVPQEGHGHDAFYVARLKKA